MNLRTIESEEPAKVRYWYFFNYGYQSDSGVGEGMIELSYINRPITDYTQIREMADYIKEENNKKENADKWKAVIIRNFTLLRIQGEQDAVKPRETETSTENDTEVPQGSQG